MANTYTQLDVQLVFAVKGRQSLINKAWKDELYKYITGIVQNNKHKMLRINGMPDHVHIFIGYNPNQLIPDLVEEIKTSTNGFIKMKKFCPYAFSWQNGYGAFSYGRSQRNAVINYIEGQEEHHKRKTFRDEYIEMLKKFEIDYKVEYLFDFLDVDSW
jgi:REP element-mobilizing transposase RayT